MSTTGMQSTSAIHHPPYDLPALPDAAKGVWNTKIGSRLYDQDDPLGRRSGPSSHWRKAWRGKVLVVDDHQANRELLVAILEDSGYVVSTACDGETGLSQFNEIKPDLVLLDVQMPQLNGFEVCRRLKENPETRLVPVVLVTGLYATRDGVQG